MRSPPNITKNLYQLFTNKNNRIMETLLKPVTKNVLEVITLPNVTPDGFIGYYKANSAAIDKALTRAAVKFKGIQIDTQEDFKHIVDSISEKFMSYIDGNSPRTKLSSNIYTSTEYDKTQKITMHNELSYSAKWPNKLFFSCLQPAAEGGETLIADSRAILKEMDLEIVNEIAEKGLIYVRNLHGGAGLGPSWQETFETEDKNELEAYCKSYGINLTWSANGNVKLKQYSKGIINHRVTGERLWFNQMDQFHPIQLGEEMKETLSILYDSPEEYPMYVTFGDGKNISEDIITEVLNTIAKVTVAPVWERNELLILDNELLAHGRNPYAGNRKVLVSMSE